MNLPQNFSESYVVAKKKHAEAVSFLSVFWPSYYLLLISFAEPIFYQGMFVVLTIWLLLLLLDSKIATNRIVVLFIIASITLFWLVWVIARFWDNSPCRDEIVLFVVSIIAAFGGVERTVNKLKREMQTAQAYATSTPKQRLIRESTLFTKPKE